MCSGMRLYQCCVLQILQIVRLLHNLGIAVLQPHILILCRVSHRAFASKSRSSTRDIEPKQCFAAQTFSMSRSIIS